MPNVPKMPAGTNRTNSSFPKNDFRMVVSFPLLSAAYCPAISSVTDLTRPHAHTVLSTQ
jgi:hypothetical protein